MTTTPITSLDINVLFAGPTNPRKKFAAADLDELCASIKEQGIIQPLLVRKVGDRYEIVAGERRWRAGKQAEMQMLPCIIRTMTDSQVLEHQLIENLQRKDLEPLEEAIGFRQMMDLKGPAGESLHTAESISIRIGKSKHYVHRRLKLLNLSESAQQALEDGTIPPSTAEMLARIPDDRMREKAAKEVLTPKHYDRPLTVLETKALIERNYMRTLEGCSFDPEDESLLSEKVKCSACPHRAGNCPDIEGVRADMCLNPICFEKKARAHFDRWKDQHRTGPDPDAVKFLSPSETRKHISGDHIVNWASNMVALDEPPQSHFLNSKAAGMKIPPWRELIAGRGVEVIVARKSDDTALECADRVKATEAAKLNGHNIFKLTNREEREAFEQQQKLERVDRKRREEVFGLVHKAIAGKAGKDAEQWLRQLLQIYLEQIPEMSSMLQGAFKLSSAKKLGGMIAEAKGAGLCDLAAAVAFTGGVSFSYEILPIGAKVLKTLQIDAKKIRGELDAAEKKQARKKEAEVNKAKPKKEKLGERILAELKARGDSGATVKDLAKKIGVAVQNIHIWFATTGKKNKEIQKVGAAQYRLFLKGPAV